MGHKFAEIAFTDSVRQVQQQLGSRGGYASLDGGQDYNHRLSEREAEFIGARDSFYMASVSETGWPYLQHRGGPAGFVRIIDAHTIGFADFSGNRQYVSVGNLRRDDRVSLFFMDYPNRSRLKVLGRVRLVNDDEPELLARLEMDDYRAVVERGFLIHIEAFDWNCPQHITPRYSDGEVEATIAPLLQQIEDLEDAGGRQQTPRRLGSGPLPLIITGVRQLTPQIRAYELRDPDGGELPAVQAGAHLQVPVMLDNVKPAIRHYSICSNPGRRDIYEIAVQREQTGSGGSIALHRSFEIGMTLNCALPQNNFALHDDDRPAVLIAGGIGITAIKPMAQALQARANPLRIHYAARSRQQMAFGDRLQREFADKIRLYSSAEDERIDIDKVLSAAADDTLFYVCGPERMIDAVRESAERLQISTDRIRFERFDAATIRDAKAIQLELRRSNRQIEVAADQSILDALLASGIDAIYSCRSGSCRSCALRVLEGEPDHRDQALSNAEREQDKLFCPCVSRARGDRLVLDL
jgi:ferredoxin-NADP reductase/predicted pyridoxine 5'-phosphate oxidase superfamily flavin-nucleotide-binding protein